MSINYSDVANMPLPGEGDGGDAPGLIGDFWGGGDPGGVGGIPYAPGMAPDPYFAGEEFDILRGLTTEDRIRLQQQFVALGLASSVVYGEIDGGTDGKGGTLGAMRSLLAMANRSGEDWTAVLGRIAVNPAMQEETDAFDPTPFLRPDYATVAQEVKARFRQTLGRDPDRYELQHLAGELTGFYEMEYEATSELEQILHEAAVTPGSQQVGERQNVDPLSRFQELFEQKYKHEIDFVEDKAEAVRSRQVVEAGTDTLSQMSRRGY